MLKNIKFVALIINTMESYLRSSDERKAQIVNDFLYEHFYSKYTTDYVYHTDKETQVKGVDVTFKYNGREYKCDEKAAVNWCNVRLETYAFEICSFNRAGNIQLGWLIDDDKINDSFMLVWLNKTKNKTLVADKSEIEEMDIMIMRKDALRGYLDSIGWNKENLLAQARIVWDNPSMDTINVKNQNIQIRVSTQLVEHPVNIRLPKAKLSELADCYIRLIA